MMFERFTDTARSVLVQAQKDARRIGHNYIGCEHLLLAAARVGEPAAAVLRDQGVTPERVESQIVRLGDLNSMPAGTEVTRETLAKAGLIRDAKGPAKLLANGKVTKAYTIKGVKMSASVREAIAAAGGRVEE